MSSYSRCRELKIKVQYLQWQRILYRYEVDRRIRHQTGKVKTSLILINLMNRLNQKWVQKELVQYPCVLTPGEIRGAKGRQRYLKRRWQYFSGSWIPGYTRVPLLRRDEGWRDQIKRHPWYRCVPLVTWLATWEIGLTYLPTSSKREAWRDWPNPEARVHIGTSIVDNDKVWTDWSKRCGDLVRTKDIGFYEEEYIEAWWSHLHTVNKREVLRWLLYDRSDYRWHHPTGAWMYYLGKIPGLGNHEPRTILHSRGRPSYYEPCVNRAGNDTMETHREYNEESPEIDAVISEKDWNKYCREIEATRAHCRQVWPNAPVKGIGCNSLGRGTWVAISKEDALEEQRKLCERIAHHKVGQHRDGHFSRAESTYIISPFVRQEQNLPLFPDHEANMALIGTGEPNGWRYNVRIINPGLSIRMGKQLLDTWLNTGVTPALMQVNPPGFISGPSQSSEVIYSIPGEKLCAQARSRLLLRDLSRSHDVQQGIAVAKKYGDMPKLLDSEVLKESGPVNHPPP